MLVAMGLISILIGFLIFALSRTKSYSLGISAVFWVFGAVCLFVYNKIHNNVIITRVNDASTSDLFWLFLTLGFIGALFLIFTKWKTLRNVLGTVLLVVAIGGMSILFTADIIGQDNVSDSDAGNEHILKTVAHVDLSARDDLELVAMDTESDVAYYKYVTPERDVSVGETVYLFEGVEATLTSIDAVGFTFTCDSLIDAGMSGTAVLNSNGEQIGYISRRLSTGNYFAIWS